MDPDEHHTALANELRGIAEAIIECDLLSNMPSLGDVERRVANDQLYALQAERKRLEQMLAGLES